MYGASWFDIIVILIICFLPSLAVLLSILAAVLAFIRATRILSLILAFLCLAIYAVFVIVIMQSELFNRQLDALPFGRCFSSMVPLITAMAVIGFGIYAVLNFKRRG